MMASTVELSVVGHAAAALVHVMLVPFLLRARHAGGHDGLPMWSCLLAIVASALWAAAAAWDPLTHSATPAFVASLFDLVRYGAWLMFLLALLEPRLSGGWRGLAGKLALGAAAVWLLAVVAWAQRVAVGNHLADQSALGLASSLALAVFGLLLTEQLFRNLPADSRWNAKPVCLALAVLFVFDTYMHSEALLFGRFDADAVAVRGLVHSLALPLLFIVITRRGNWLQSLKVSQTAAFYSATLVLAGAYMLFMAGIGYYVRFFGGEWGRALQLGLLFAAGLGLLGLVLSSSLRARVRVFVTKHFFSYRYDYRQEWLRFTAMLSSRTRPQEVSTLIVRGLAEMVECPGGALWTRQDREPDFRQTARWNAPEVTDAEPADSAFCRYLQRKAWVVDLLEYRSSPRQYGQLALPLWLLSSTTSWLVVPLLVGEELLGFVVLAQPRTPMDLNWEVRDLLKTASRQAAGFLAQMQATEQLLEARKFEAFNRMSAFVVHDLKNIVTQLSLMLKNAQRLHDNREFQQDMLLTVESSLEKMRRLMLQLREGAAPVGGALGVELVPLLKRLQRSAEDAGRRLELDIRDRLSTRGHDERLERVLGHLVQNALDATPAHGRVWMRLERASGQVNLEIGDTGAGMTEEFIRTRLFRPFATTKESGMGIGTYESAQYIRELGGTLEVASAPERGTRLSIVLPLFEAQTGSDLRERHPSSSTGPVATPPP